MKLIRNFLLALCFTSVTMAQTVINFAGNAASYDPVVARGSMVVLIGTGLGPSPIQVAGAFPLLTVFAGVSVKVTINGVMTDGIMYYASDAQSAFILDSDTPAGTGTVVLTYNGQMSPPFPITVVDSNLGFYTLDSSGTGQVVATFHDSVDVTNPFPGNTNAINPGDLVILWGNGLGPVPFDETIGAEFLDMTNVPLQLFVNGQEVPIIYRGRSPVCCSSVDNVYFYWPEPAQAAALSAENAVNSCSSSISARIGGRFSNMGTLPAADRGTRTCTNTPDPGPGDATNPLDFLLSQAGLDRNSVQQAGAVTFGFLGTTHDTNYTRGFGGTTVEQIEGGTGIFAEFNTDIPGALDGLDQFLGSEVCFTEQTTSTPGDINFFGVNFRSLDAGPGILVNGPNGQRTLGRNSFGGLIAYFAEFPAGFLGEGLFTFESQGGPDVNAFNTSAQAGGPVNWTNREQLLTIIRNNGFQVIWTSPTSGWVTVSGESSSFDLSTGGFTTKSFSCTGPASQGSLTVPGNIASFVDPSNAIAFQYGQLSVDAIQLFPLPGTGLDIPVLAFTSAITQDVEYQ